MKKILIGVLVVVAVIILIIAGCKNKNKGNNIIQSNNNTSSGNSYVDPNKVVEQYLASIITWRSNEVFSDDRFVDDSISFTSSGEFNRAYIDSSGDININTSGTYSVDSNKNKITLKLDRGTNVEGNYEMENGVIKSISFNFTSDNGEKKLVKYYAGISKNKALYGLENGAKLKDNVEKAKIQVEKALDDYFEKTFDAQYADVKYNNISIITSEKEKTISSLNISDNDVAFELDYEILPSNGINPDVFTAGSGRLNETGWVVEKHNCGIIKQNAYGLYFVDFFETSF